jgi:hypothetical protein
MLFKEIITVYSEKYTKPINTKHSEILIVKAGDAYSYHLGFKGLGPILKII